MSKPSPDIIIPKEGQITRKEGQITRPRTTTKQHPENLHIDAFTRHFRQLQLENNKMYSIRPKTCHKNISISQKTCSNYELLSNTIATQQSRPQTHRYKFSSQDKQCETKMSKSFKVLVGSQLAMKKQETSLGNKAKAEIKSFNEFLLSSKVNTNKKEFLTIQWGENHGLKRESKLQVSGNQKEINNKLQGKVKSARVSRKHPIPSPAKEQRNSKEKQSKTRQRENNFDQTQTPLKSIIEQQQEVFTPYNTQRKYQTLHLSKRIHPKTSVVTARSIYSFKHNYTSLSPPSFITFRSKSTHRQHQTYLEGWKIPEEHQLFNDLFCKQ